MTDFREVSMKAMRQFVAQGGQVKSGGVRHHLLFFRSPIESSSNAQSGRGLLLGKEAARIGNDLGSWAFHRRKKGPR